MSISASSPIINSFLYTLFPGEEILQYLPMTLFSIRATLSIIPLSITIVLFIPESLILHLAPILVAGPIKESVISQFSPNMVLDVTNHI